MQRVWSHCDSVVDEWDGRGDCHVQDEADEDELLDSEDESEFYMQTIVSNGLDTFITKLSDILQSKWSKMNRTKLKSYIIVSILNKIQNRNGPLKILKLLLNNEYPKNWVHSETS